MVSRVTVIDNFDSFTYNLVQYLESLGESVRVHYNNARSVQQVLDERPDWILLSPGPGNPDEAGICLDLVAEAAHQRLPLVGVCLGHQVLAQAFGARVVPADRPMHGKVSPMLHDGRGLFAGLPSPFAATRYHSLVVAPQSLPDCLEVSARTPDGTIMGLRHRSLPLASVQFHPESIMTDLGIEILKNSASFNRMIP